ncbi:hypothetical protein MMC26_002228 [Xylographa opegraphella]|nr:hypothetical protein [Xylographa opegraphella]
MPSRNVVQDSDDDDDVDAQTSPAKLLETRSEVELRPQNDGMEYLDFGSPSPPRAVSKSEGKGSSGAGSSGKLDTALRDFVYALGQLLSQAIHKAHRDLVGPSPDAQEAVLQDERASWSWTSPVIEKVKRRKTTMEEFGSSSSLGLGNNKVLKTYGSQKTRDDTALRGGAVDSRWTDGFSDAVVTGFEDDVPWLTHENKKRRATVAPTDLLAANGGSGRKKLKRSVTTAGAVTETDYGYGDEQYRESLLSSTRGANDVDFTALKTSATVSSEYLEQLTLPSMENSMRPALSKHELDQQASLKASVSSTIPNTPMEAERSQKLPSTDQTDSSARMPSPTISGKSSKEALTQSMDHVDEALNYLADVNMEEPVTHSTRSPAPEERLTSHKSTIPSRLPSTQGSASGTQDELSVVVLKDNDLPVRVEKKTSKRKLLEINNVDELGSDEVAIGLPAENYQPRPSRSRANHTVDDLVLAIDYSKRPEAVVKARNKRRKTEGDELTTTKETVDMGLSGTRVGNEAMYKADLDVLPRGEHSEDSLCAKKSAMADAPVEEVDKAASAVDPERLKKKRGRPKKQATTDDDNAVIHETAIPPIDIAVDADVLSTTSTTSTAKPPRKRKKTHESSAISEEIVIDDDDETTSIPRTAARQQSRADDGDGALDTTQNSANIIKAPSNEESAPDGTLSNAAPPETPRKAGASGKGPGKHSPLNTGKVPYRVGLSKRARIEPLLRVVRK